MIVLQIALDIYLLLYSNEPKLTHKAEHTAYEIDPFPEPLNR